MEKYGVEVSKDLVKEASKDNTTKCPNCGKVIPADRPEYYCEDCGTAPFEEEEKRGA